ncbi:MAG: L,D-transpeptidase family protein [Deinococcales bacterium]|nr:L,D-transpeptidase family protein [Chitinophagaceae bacterium]
MNKIITLSLIAIFAMASCKSKSPKSEKIITRERDMSITAANAYNDIFIDTAAVSNFVQNDPSNADLTARILSFYNQRNYEFAWFASDGLTEQARSFWNLVTYQKDTSLSSKVLSKKMRALFEEDSMSINPKDTSIIKTELMLTEYFMQSMLKNYDKGTFKRKDLESIIPRTKGDVLVLADSFSRKKNTNTEYEDANEQYKNLKNQLPKYLAIVKNGGWQTIVADKKLYKIKDSGVVVAAIKKRLAITGELDIADTSVVFNEGLVTAVKTYQTSVGIKSDGIVSQKLIDQLNITAQKRIEQILINLDRMRWLPEAETGSLIICNIPEFRVHVYDGLQEAFEMNVVVGKEGHSTVIFTGNLNEVVFAPYWNVPSSIVKKEILPKMASNSNYLKQENMEIVSGGNIPDIRQKPGGKNALGKVKFLFPNDFDIYFHDTPSKGLFKQDNRAASHGCIRLEDPTKMANYLLRNNAKWPADKINEAMNGSTELRVALEKSVPVLITYYTAWIDEKGILNFRDDIYDHDAAVAKKMFTNPL